MAERDLSAFSLRTILDFNPSTGIFKRLRKNQPCGKLATNGYRQIYVSGQLRMAHRLAWLHVYGEWPDGQVDHINQNKDDNRIENLRVVSNKENQENVRGYSHNTSGRRGVRWRESRGIWIAEIKHHKRQLHLGVYDNIVDAVAARIRAENNFFTHSPGKNPPFIPHFGVVAIDSIQASGTT